MKANMPIGIVPTMLGAVTLSNVMAGQGYEWVRHLTSWCAMIVLVCYIGKIICNPKVGKAEYSNTVTCSLYAAITMLMLAVSAYIFDYIPVLGKTLWWIGILIHAIHIVVFTYLNVIKKFDWDTFLPTWFVTYIGILVATVIGGPMNEPLVGTIIVYYGLGIYAILLPLMVYRLMTRKVKDHVYHTQTIMVAPCSISLVSYVNFIEDKNMVVMCVLYALVLFWLGFVIAKTPRFFSFDFHPGFAGLTFPMAISTVASSKMIVVFEEAGYEWLSHLANQMMGFQIYLTAMFVGYVLVKFVGMLLKHHELEMA